MSFKLSGERTTIFRGFRIICVFVRLDSASHLQAYLNAALQFRPVREHPDVQLFLKADEEVLYTSKLNSFRYVRCECASSAKCAFIFIASLLKVSKKLSVPGLPVFTFTDDCSSIHRSSCAHVDSYFIRCEVAGLMRQSEKIEPSVGSSRGM